MSVFIEDCRDDDVEHYGVLGMKWGVRKNPQKTYERSMKKLSSLDVKRQKSKSRNYEVDPIKSQKSSAASEKYSFKSSKLSTRSKKLRLRADRLRDRAFFSLTGVGKGIRTWRSNVNEHKSARLDYRSDRYKRKAEQAAKRAVMYSKGGRFDTEKSSKYFNKAKLWALEMNEIFSDVPLNAFTKNDVELGKTYGLTFIDEYTKRSK